MCLGAVFSRARPAQADGGSVGWLPSAVHTRVETVGTLQQGIALTCPTPPCSLLPLDEIDAIGTKRYDAHSGGEREIQRTMLELLNQLDGFDSITDVKVGPAPCLDYQPVD